MRPAGRELLTLKGHSGAIDSVAFSPDGQRIVTGSADHTAKVWDAASGRELLTLKGHSGHVLAVAFSPDGQRILTGSRDGTARVWEAAATRAGRCLAGRRTGGGLSLLPPGSARPRRKRRAKGLLAPVIPSSSG